ncbi:MAG TPA: hypothetical protein VMB02_08820 [Candidatus Aquilonibacter sp.]|nr:hypothetical protein [Candidatus Aquilonibacter sp.]
MDEANAPMQESVFRNVSLLLAGVVTLDVLTQVLSQWHAFGVLSKFVAVVLLMNLIVTPLVFLRAQRRGKPLGQTQLLAFAYLSVFLTTALFALRY